MLTTAARLFTLALALHLFITITAPSVARAADPRDSTVKIISTIRDPDLFRPWSKQPPSETSGTGFVIDGQRILTNAHVVQHARQVLVQPPGKTEKIRAEIEAIAAPIDLAILVIEDEEDAASFFQQYQPLVLRDVLPNAGSSVNVFGYPIGGDQVSVTEGVVSRIDFVPVDQFQPALIIQIDAAVNPGNSGGPAVHDGEVIGIVYSREETAENVGYVITSEEIKTFLDDVQDGAYDGRAYVTALYGRLENKGLREYLRVPAEVSGVVVHDAGRPHMGDLRPWDVITRIGDYAVDGTGTVAIREDIRVNFEYLLPKYAEGDEVELDVWRKGEAMKVRVPILSGWEGVLSFLGPEYPRYFVHGPLVFLPAYFGFASHSNAFTLALRDSPLVSHVLDYRGSEETGDIEEFVVVLSPFLPHPIAQGYDDPDMYTVKTVNGTKIRSLAHLVEVIRDLEDEWVILEWYETSAQSLVFPRQEMNQVTEEILDDNGIRERMSEDLRDVWEG